MASGPNEALAMVRDITKRKKVEKALKESEERYALAAQGATDGLWDWDLRGNKIHYSARWKGMLGYGEEEIDSVPDEWFEKIHTDDIDRVKLEINAHVGGVSSHFQSEHRISTKTAATAGC